MSNETTKERQKAVALAWKNERARVLEGKGTRDWSQKEQRQIIATGKAKGYEGHHMQSVNGHKESAGDCNNIQFLTRKEHLAAHKGNFKNQSNGYYDPNTGKITSFDKSKNRINSAELKAPLNQKQKDYALKKAESVKKAKAEKAKEYARARRSVNKTSKSTEKSASASKTLSGQRKAEGKSGTSSTKSKTLAAQRNTSEGKSATKSKTLAAQRSASASKSSSEGKSASVSHGKSSGGHSSSGGRSSSGGHSSSGGRGH